MARCSGWAIERLRSRRSPTAKAPAAVPFTPPGHDSNLPKEELVLAVAPLLADQELDVSVRYWEGAIAVRGTAQGVPVNGRGYLELTGYAE